MTCSALLSAHAAVLSRKGNDLIAALDQLFDHKPADVPRRTKNHDSDLLRRSVAKIGALGHGAETAGLSETKRRWR